MNHNLLRQVLRPAALLFLSLLPVLPMQALAQSTATTESNMYEQHPAPAARSLTLGILLFPGFEMLDAYGPMEMWGSLKHAPASQWGGEDRRTDIRLVTVAATAGPVASNQGPKTVADFSFADAPKLDYLLVPGGIGAIPLVHDAATLDWLRARAKEAKLVMSVCNGASLLAAAGILDGRPATTNKMAFKMSTAPGPKAHWVAKARWVDDGTVVTSSGVSAGMDMTIAVISRLYGQPLAAWVARITEYEPHRDAAWDPFAVMAGLAK